MAVSKQELKQRAIAAIDKNRDKIIALGDSIFSEPELGYKEVKTSAKLKAVFDELGYKYQDGVAITGIVAPLKGKESKIRVAVMGEMDAVVAPGHRCANRRCPLLRPQLHVRWPGWRCLRAERYRHYGRALRRCGADGCPR